MKKAFWLTGLLTLLFLETVSAQVDYFAYENGRFEPGISVYVFSENSALKERPAVEAQDLLPLNQGDKLVIVNIERAILERNGLNQFWYRVDRHNDSGEVHTGFISGHDIALGALPFLIDYQRDLLLFQITEYNRSEAYTMTAKIVRNGFIVATLDIPFISFPMNPEWPDYTFAVLKNIQAGIDSASEVAEITFHHQKSQYPSGISYLVWNGTHLGHLCETMYLKEPGLYEYDSFVTYPGRDGVKAGSVRTTEIIREYDETTGKYTETDRQQTTYFWDGTQVTSSEQ